MAARLLRIKAQMLLPRATARRTWDDPRAELVRRLLEYQQMREVVDVLERAGEERRNRFARALSAAAARAAAGAARASLCELLAAVDRVLRVATRARRCTTSWPAPLDVTGAIGDHSRAARARAPRARSDWLVARGRGEPWQVLSTLLGLLELAKLGELPRRSAAPFRQRGDHA